MADELSNVGAPVSDEQIEDRILSTLPPSFHGARAAWETLLSGEHRNLIRLTARMVLEETRNKALPGGGINPADVAFFASHPSKIQKSTDENTETAAHGDYRGGYRGRGYRGRGYRGCGPRQHVQKLCQINMLRIALVVCKLCHATMLLCDQCGRPDVPWLSART